MKNFNTNRLFNLFLYFLIYSFTGWIIETVYMFAYLGHFTKRGFLSGPLCGTYGVGTILVLYILYGLRKRPFLLFLGSSLITTVLELLAGLGLQELFGKRLWDYSNKPLNYMGLICFRNTIIWGLLSLLVVYLIHPAVVKFLNSIPFKTKEVICSSALILLMLDITLSVYSNLNGIDNFSVISYMILQRLKYLSNASW